MNVTKPSVEIIDMKDYDEMIRKIEKIGRVCYKSEGNITEESAERFIRNILKRGHESVIEHEAVTVRMICDAVLPMKLYATALPATVRKVHVTVTTPVTNSATKLLLSISPVDFLMI